MMTAKAYPTFLLALMGSMDCLTTVIGILYFGAVELNPLLAGVASSNLPAFVVLKLATTVLVCAVFVQAEKMLMKSKDKTTKAFSFAHKMLRVSNVGVIGFLVIVVSNNLLVLAYGL